MEQTASVTEKASTVSVDRSRSGERGFTLMEIVVILAVLAILIATLTPTVLKYINDSQLARAKNDVQMISAAMGSIIQDTGQYPGALADANFLCGPGSVSAAIANGNGWATTLVGAIGVSCTLTAHTATLGNSLASHLVVNDPSEDGAGTDYTASGNFRWKGPYVQSLNEDPWGNAYQINVSTLTGSNTAATWVISAGPNGVFDTATTATAVAGDDIGIRIK
ncbi:MAG TPA: type II secretion system protein GspG [Candidatus Binatia bacterium]|jgi:type II secretory pathway pseudopilin PulG